MRNYDLNEYETTSVAVAVKMDREYLQATGAGAILMSYGRATTAPTGYVQ